MEMEEPNDTADQDERMVINTNEFINEIKENPCIWNYTSDEYSSVTTRVLAWEKIFRKFSENYDELDQNAKEEISRKLQRKWKTLRDGFSRYLAHRKKSNRGRASRPYTYFHQLSFLMKPKKGTLEPTRLKQMRTFATQPRGRPRTTPGERFGKQVNIDIAPIKIEQQDSEEVSLAQLVRAADPLENSVMQASVQVLASQEAPSSSQSQQCLVASDFDEDKYFLLSLCRDFKKIPEEFKLDAKGEIIDVLRKYTASRIHGTEH